ncbi:Serine/threonine-protein phosphatase 6 regulatory ankyrin repeat subunit C [Beauveria bassiana]|nr:Serine/threonine-protein phosphatase 6 regulatory ankyrin repeat subunit C [Beauveria bassiana]
MSRLLQQYLLRRNVQRSGTSCLPHLAKRGDMRQIRLLQAYEGFRTDARDCDGDTALLRAIEADHESIALALIEIGGPHVNMRNGRHSRRPLTLAVCNDQTNVVRKLLECDDIEPNGVRHTDYGRPVFLACESGNEEIFKLLITSSGIDLSMTDPLGRTALHVAARHGSASVVEMLLDDGRISPDFLDADGQTALEIAFTAGKFDAIEVMYAHGIRAQRSYIEQASKHLGERFTSKFLTLDSWPTLLHICSCAAARGHAGLVNELLPYANRQQREQSLVLAAYYGHVETVELLLKYQSPNFEDRRKRTPEWYARSQGHFSTVRLFKSWNVAQGVKRKRDGSNHEGQGQNKRNPIIID